MTIWTVLKSMRLWAIFIAALVVIIGYLTNYSGYPYIVIPLVIFCLVSMFAEIIHFRERPTISNDRLQWE